MNKKFVKIVALVLAALMVLSVASVLIYTFAGSRRSSYYMITSPAPVIENSIDGANGNLLFSFDNVKNPAS